MSSDFAGLSILSSKLLYPPDMIEPMITSTDILLRSIATQWAGSIFLHKLLTICGVLLVLQALWPFRSLKVDGCERVSVPYQKTNGSGGEGGLWKAPHS